MLREVIITRQSAYIEVKPIIQSTPSEMALYKLIKNHFTVKHYNKINDKTTKSRRFLIAKDGDRTFIKLLRFGAFELNDIMNGTEIKTITAGLPDPKKTKPTKLDKLREMQLSIQESNRKAALKYMADDSGDEASSVSSGSSSNTASNITSKITSVQSKESLTGTKEDTREQAAKDRPFVIKNMISLLDNNKLDAKFEGSLNPTQQALSDYMMHTIYSEARLKEGRAGCVLKLEAGQGKTYISMWLIGALKRRTLIVVHTRSMLFQWRKLIKKHFPTVNVGVYYGEEKFFGDITIGTIHSLIKDGKPINVMVNIGGGSSSNKASSSDQSHDKQQKKLYPVMTEMTDQEFFRSFDFVIMDECHVMMSHEFYTIFFKAQAPYMLGLSATPDEDLYGRSPVLRWGLGEILDFDVIKHKLNITIENVKFKAKVQAIKYSGHPDYTKVTTNDRGTVSFTESLSKICADPYRNKLIILKIRELLDMGLNVLVFSDRLSHLDKIRKLLVDEKISFVFEANTAAEHLAKEDPEFDKPIEEEPPSASDNTAQGRIMLKPIDKSTSSALDRDAPLDAEKIDYSIYKRYLKSKGAEGEIKATVKESKSRSLGVKLVGGSLEDDISSAEDNNRLILSTYKFMSTGVSMKKLNALVLATPRRSYAKQFVNRIFRLGSDHTITRQIVDIIDSDTYVKKLYDPRKEHYKEQKYDIVSMPIKWHSIELNSSSALGKTSTKVTMQKGTKKGLPAEPKSPIITSSDED